MLLPKKACLAVRRGYFSPPVVIILALITLAVAFVIYFNRGLILKSKNQQAQQTVSPSPISKSSPTPSADKTVYTDEGSANWKMYQADKFTIKVPNSWAVSVNNNNTYSFNDGQLYVIKSSRTQSELDVEYFNQFHGQPKTRSLQLGNATAKEYFGCLGVEGCIDAYVIIAINGTQQYEILFTTNLGQEKILYESIISSLKFTE